MTVAQLVILRDAILADPAVNTIPMGSDGDFAIALYYNGLVAPPYIVWRTAVPIAEIMTNGFDWTRVDNLSVGKARIWEWLKDTGTINPAQANIRAGIDATWVGTAADLAVRAAVYVHCKRAATRFEKLFATGSGTDASPSTMTLEGAVSLEDVGQARAT
jgi:hypothetical protein